MFYHLPKVLVEKRPECLEIPRKIREVVYCQKWRDLIESDAFLELVLDCYAWLGWQFFKVPNPKGGYMPIPGSWGQYSGDFPIWRYAYSVPPLIAERLEAMPTKSLQSLFNAGKDYEVPWIDYDVFYGVFGRMTEAIVEEKNWQPAFDMLWEKRMPEDYNGASLKRNDFQRSWNHSRKPDAQISVEKTLEEGTMIDNQMVHDFEDSSIPLEQKVESEVFVERFKETLSERDQRILELRVQNVPLAEIAKEVGYSNAGAVSKRIQQIAHRYDDYQAQSEDD